MIIFGFRGMVKALAMLTLVCRNCGNPAAQRLVQYTRWFTLFFIPVFPISRRRVMTCTFCGQGTKLSKDQAEGLIASAHGPVSPGPVQEQLPPAPPAPPRLPEAPQA